MHKTFLFETFSVSTELHATKSYTSFDNSIAWSLVGEQIPQSTRRLLQWKPWQGETQHSIKKNYHLKNKISSCSKRRTFKTLQKLFDLNFFSKSLLKLVRKLADSLYTTILKPKVYRSANSIGYFQKRSFDLN